MFKLTVLSLCLLLPLAIAQQCTPVPQLPCGDGQDTGNACTSQTLNIQGATVSCCEIANPQDGGHKCAASQEDLATTSTAGQRSTGNKNKGANDIFKENLIKKPSKHSMKQLAKMAANALKRAGAEDIGNRAENFDETKIQQRSLGFAFGGLGGLLGGGALYPECPVHVKMCYRVPCGGYNRRFLDNNPKQCLSDPRCCYDYKLAFMRRISPKFYGDTPICYYGPTSKQWVYLTNFFKPWNPWYTDYILKVFKELFNTNAFNVGGKFICEIDFQKKAYPVGAGSKLECDLVSGCWDESFPEGLQCFMAGSFAQKLFGQNEVYPSLFTSDPSETQCSANWFDFGPKAYNRLPCAVGPPPDSIFDMLYKWCPSTDCCINYATVGSSGMSGLASLQFLGQGGGLPGGFPGIFSGLPNFGGPAGGAPQTPFDSNIFSYLFAGGNSDLSDLFCPYRTFFSSSLFPDFDDDIEGCCDIPMCYHKKKLVGGGTRPPPPPTRPPPPPPPPQGIWGQWGPCSAPCRRYGTRTRICLLHGQQTSPNYCVGPSSEQCQGNCPITYRWGQWRQASQCDKTCGEGSARYQRDCFQGSQQVSPSSCPGGFSQQSKTDRCNNGPCPTLPPTPPPPRYRWSELRVLEPCSVTCGSGYEVWGRQCLGPALRVVPNRFCPGNAQRHNRGCTKRSCPMRAQWTAWDVIAPCGATCGDRGLKHETRQCKYQDGRDAGPNACPPDAQGYRDSKITQCNAADCPQGYYWVGWRADCSLQGGRYCVGQQYVKQYRSCYSLANGRFSPVNPQSRCGPLNMRERQVLCTPQVCMGQ